MATSEPAKIRTKYDRMFERKNDGVLTSHYRGLVDSDSEDEERPAGFRSDGDDGGDVFELARADHALDGDEQRDVDEKEAREAAMNNMSKRALKRGMSKKAMAEAGKRGMSTKLTFDDAGEAHELYELQDEDTFRQAGDATEQAAAHALAERARLNEQDVADRERVRDQRREKRRLRKEREREARGEGRDEPAQAALPPDADDDWQEPDWVLPGDDNYPAEPSSDAHSDTESEGASLERPRKRTRRSPASAPKDGSLAEDEALALQLLGA